MLLTSAALTAALLAGCGEGENSASESGEAQNVDKGAAGNPEGGPMAASGGSVEGIDSNLELSQSQVNQEFTERDKDSSYEESEAVKVTLNGTNIQADKEGCTFSGSTLTITGEGIYLLSGTLSEGQIIVDAGDNDKVQIVLNGAKLHCETSAVIYVKNADKVFLTLADGTENTLSGGAEYVQTDDNTVDGVIFSKDDLTVNGNGSLQIDAAYKHGIVSKNDLTVTGGNITVQAVGQCLSGKDCIKIADGTFTLSGQGKGLKSENTEETEKGNIYVAGGTFFIDTEDDAFHSSGSIVVDGGEFDVKSGDDAFHSDLDLVINGGIITVDSCYEGLEGLRVVINSGEISLTADDDGVNAAKSSTEEEKSDIRGGPGDGSMENETDAYIKITGGSLTVNAEGDGLDSNGSLFITGGTTYVNGPVSNGDGALDYNGGSQITGGTLIAAGSSGMAQGLGEESTQCSILQNLTQSQEAGTSVILTDSDGLELLSWTPEKEYSSVVISCPQMEQGQTYTLTTGSESTDLTLESIVTSNGTSFGHIGGMNGRGQDGGKAPDMSEMPSSGEFPPDGELPSKEDLPEGMTPPEDGQFPENREKPEEINPSEEQNTTEEGTTENI